ncbi:MAG: ASPIC/UnbV domain-containing protein, partial [Arenicella sp.]|nr:ASPIC/UnbV domain-containing protein [Arenicella sp.]
DLDIVLTRIGESPRLLRNDQATGHNWIQVQVVDDLGAPAIGAEVEIVSSAQRQHGRIEPTRSYLSQVEPVLSFGIGFAGKVDRANIKWANGTTLTINDPAINQRHLIAPD